MSRRTNAQDPHMRVCTSLAHSYTLVVAPQQRRQSTRNRGTLLKWGYMRVSGGEPKAAVSRRRPATTLESYFRELEVASHGSSTKTRKIKIFLVSTRGRQLK